MAVSNYRILWTIPSLPYNTRRINSLYGNNSYLIQHAYMNASHATEYSLEYGESLTFSAVLQEYRTYSTTTENSYYDFAWTDKNGVTHYVYQYWSNVEAQIKFYHGDYSQWDYITDLPDTNLITGVNNNNSTQQVTDYEVTAVATIGAGSTQNYITNDHITIKLVPDETDFGIYIGDSSTSPMTVTLPDSGSYTKNIKVYCTSTGNYLTSGSFYFTGDQFIYDNCTITPEIETTVKQAFIEAKIDTSQGILYKPYSGTFIITGSVKTDTSTYSNSLTINFSPGEDDLIDLNVPNEFALTYSEEVIINAELLSVPGLILKVTIPSAFTGLNSDNTPKFIPDISTYTTSGSNKTKISDPVDNGIDITLKHNVRQLGADASGNITIEAYEYTQDPSTGVITLGTKYATKTIRVIFDKIWMPDPVTVIINQLRKKVYFEISKKTGVDGQGNDVFSSPTKVEEGQEYTEGGTYSAQAEDIADFTKKYKIACFGSNWKLGGIFESDKSTTSQWIHTSLDEGIDRENPAGVDYKFSVWVIPNREIIQRTGYIRIDSTKTVSPSDNTPRASVWFKVDQQAAVYDTDFTVSMCPAWDCSNDGHYPVTLSDSSICSSHVYIPVAGKQYNMRITNNCPYDILVIDSIEFEGHKTYTGNQEYTNKGWTDYYTNHGYPDIDKKINTSNENISSSENIHIDYNYINGNNVSDNVWTIIKTSNAGMPNSKYEISGYQGSVKAVTVKIPPMGVLHQDGDPSKPVVTSVISDKYMSLKVTCHNISGGASLTVNTDPRVLHQVGLLREAAYEGYDIDPDNDDELIDLLRTFKYTAEENRGLPMPGEDASIRAFSVRTGYEIFRHPDGLSGVTNNVETSSDPLWNESQILDERCIVLPKDSVGYTVTRAANGTRTLTWQNITYKTN